MLQLSVGGRRKPPSRKLWGLQTHEGDAAREIEEDTQDNGEGVLFQLTTPGMSFAAALRGKTEEQQQPRTHQVVGPDTMNPGSLRPYPNRNSRVKDSPNVNSLSPDKMLKGVVTVVHRIMKV
jgi:hypothetical protein